MAVIEPWLISRLKASSQKISFFLIFLLENEKSSTKNQISATMEKNMTDRNQLECIVDKTNPTEMDPEHQLIEHLMKNYNQDTRPVLDKTKPVRVLFDLAFSQIVELVRI